MEALYQSIGEAWDTATEASVWRHWVWDSDCNAPPLERCCDMNKMHLWGILCCLREAAFPNDAYERTLPFLIPDLPLMHLYEHTPIANFSLRELLDQLECMQLHWGQIISLMGDEGSLDLLKACMARLGFFAHHAFVITDDESQPSLVDDPQHITIVPRTLDHYPSDLEPHMQLCILSRKTLRQTVCLLLCLARVQQIVCQSTLIASHPLEKSVVEALKQHHVEASMDFFNLLQQMMHLAPGMRLVYRTNFAGMYNDVSQVTYFHYPKYARQPQKPLEEIIKHSMHMLPLLKELLPDIPVHYEDDSEFPQHGWTWLVCCGAVFLRHNDTATIYRSPDLAPLAGFLLEKLGRSVNGGNTPLRRVEAMTEHGHISLL